MTSSMTPQPRLTLEPQPRLTLPEMTHETHYADIYDLADKNHSTPRWDKCGQRWRYYEGYGRDCSEKTDFMISINRDHELWVGEIPERETKVKVDFGESAKVRYIGSESLFEEEKVDMGDREDRVSWNFGKMLCDYCEKTGGPEGRADFFKYGGKGRSWNTNKQMMKDFSPLFESIKESLSDESFKVSISDQSVKDYPRRHFRDLYKRYKESMKSTSLLRASAVEFGPSQVSVDLLSDIKPERPVGPPPPRRPTASSQDASASKRSLVDWTTEMATDKKIEDLEKKLDLLIEMNGPVVCATMYRE